MMELMERERATNGAALPARWQAAQNVSNSERWLSIAGGGMLAAWGLSRFSLAGTLLAGVGAGLIYRGWTGHCRLYDAVGRSTAGAPDANTGVPAGPGCQVEKSIYVDRPAGELYSFWRNLENLPRVLSHLQSVTMNGNRSHWVARNPKGRAVEWDAELINDKPDLLIAWHSLPGAQVDTAGSVQFEGVLGRGTDVRVKLKYDPPGRRVAAAIASLVDADAGTLIEQDLDRFKQLAESNQLPGGRRMAGADTALRV